MAKFTYVSLFSGIGGFETALNRLGGECVLASEIDKYANKAYEILYGHPTAGDITKIVAEDVPDHDLLVGGFPCFPAGQRVITKTGFKNIEDIKEGDYVLTHKGRYRAVVTPMDKLYNGDLYEITMKYYRLPIKVTSEHPFYTKRGWVDAKDLTESDYVGFPLNKKSDLPIQLKYRKKINQSKEIEVTTSLPYEKEAFWKLVGYWLADGWTQDKRKKRQGIRRAYRVLFAMNETKEKFLIPLLDELKINYSVTHERTCKKVHVVNQELWLFIKQFTKGNHASDKFLPEFVQDLPINLAKSLIEGYKAGDGATVNGYTQFTSTSVELLEGLQRLLLKTDKQLYSLHQSHKAGKTTIEGREVNTKDCYMLRGGETQGVCAEFTEDYVFFKVDKIRKEKVENLPVYNIEVEEDNSYCLPLVAVHNCQAFSVAGKRLGFDDTRGTLFFEIARIAKVKRPKLLLLENVKGLVSHDKGKTLDTIVQTLNDIGYTVDFNVLNSKYFGVPQNRERIFIVGVLDGETTEWNIVGNGVVAKGKKRIQALPGVKTFNFDWPSQEAVTTRIRDILEDNVAEKYYLSEDKTAKLIAQLELRHTDEQTIIKRDGHGYHEFRETAPTLAANAGTGGNNMPFILDTKPKDAFRIYEEVCPTLQMSDYKEPKQVVEPKIAEPQQFSEGSGISYCLDANYMKGTAPGDVGKGRRTHVVEEYTVIQKTHGCSTTVKYDETGTLQAARLDKVPMVVREEVEPSLKFIGGISESPNWLDDGKNLSRNYKQGSRIYDSDGLSSALSAQGVGGLGGHTGLYLVPQYRIRKLTPLECFRLQGFPDEYHAKLVAANISDSQLYKMAGNAVTVNVIEAIGKRLILLLGVDGGGSVKRIVNEIKRKISVIINAVGKR